jgi:hypothetical protein
MARNLKLSLVLGLVVLASAALAPAASAWQFQHEEKGALGTELNIVGKKVKWNFSFGQLECVEHGEGPEEALESSEDLYTLTSDECSGFEGGQVATNGCQWDYQSSAVNFTGTVDIDCPANAKIEFKEPGCTVTVAGQKGLSPLTFSNRVNGGGLSEREITIEFKVTNLQYEEDNVAPGNSCKKAGMLQKTGTITGFKVLTDENKTTKAMKGTWVA